MRRRFVVLCAALVTATTMAQASAASLPVSVVRPMALATRSVWTPTPAKAYGDQAPVYGRCHSSVPATAPTACYFGDLSSPYTVVLMGDSHAVNWVPGLISAATSNHWRLVTVTKTTCPAMPVNVTQSTSLTHPVPYYQCATWRKNVFRTIASWHPRVVIVAGSHTTRMIAANGQVYARDPASILRRDAVWRAATASLLTTLKSRVPKAVVLVAHDTPIARADVLECVSRYGSAAGRVCSVTQTFALNAGERAAEIAALSANPRARVVDLLTAVCAAGRCPPAAHGVLRYRNAGHLTATFSRSLAWVWRAVLTRVLRPLPAAHVLWPVVPIPTPPPPVMPPAPTPRPPPSP
jgi:hypothetical protein